MVSQIRLFLRDRKTTKFFLMFIGLKNIYKVNGAIRAIVELNFEVNRVNSVKMS